MKGWTGFNGTGRTHAVGSGCDALLLGCTWFGPSGWQALSGGAGVITEHSLFDFDDVFGEGGSCLEAGAALRALSPRGETGRGRTCVDRSESTYGRGGSSSMARERRFVVCEGFVLPARLGLMEEGGTRRVRGVVALVCRKLFVEGGGKEKAAGIHPCRGKM